MKSRRRCLTDKHQVSKSWTLLQWSLTIYKQSVTMTPIRGPTNNQFHTNAQGPWEINHLKRAQGYLWRCSVITWLLIEAIQAKGTWGPSKMNSYINPGSKCGPVKFLHCCSISGRWGNSSDMRWTKRASQSGLSANDSWACNDALQ